MEIEEARLLSRKIGFTHLIDLRTNKSITTAVKKTSKQLSCIYMHIREDGSIYIGKAKNITLRHQSHVQQGHPMSFLALFFCSPAMLGEKETELIERAEQLGLELANRDKKTPAVLFDGSLAFDELFSESRQTEFLHAVQQQKHLRETLLQQIIASSSLAHRESWSLLERRADAAEILSLASLYLSGAVPEPKSLAGSFWIATLAKFNNKNRRVPLLTITTGRSIGLEVFCFSRSEFAAFAEVRLASTIIAPNAKTQKAITDRYPWVAWQIPPIKPFTVDELMAAAPFGPYADEDERDADLLKPTTQAAMRPPATAMMALSHCSAFLADPDIALAAAVHAVSRMRVGVAMRPEHHNPIAGFALASGISVDVLS